MKELNQAEISRVIEMAWEDRTTFKAIELETGLKEAEVIKLMRRELRKSSFRHWRKRVYSSVSKKSIKKRLEEFKPLRKTKKLKKLYKIKMI